MRLRLGRSGRDLVGNGVLSERLILPVVAFLLLGYAAGLARLTERLRVSGAANVLLLLLPQRSPSRLAGAAVWQPMRAAAESLTRQLGSHELAMNYAASKAGLLFPGKTVRLSPAGLPRVTLRNPVELVSRPPRQRSRPRSMYPSDLPGLPSAPNSTGVHLDDPGRSRGSACRTPRRRSAPPSRTLQTRAAAGCVPSSPSIV